VQPFAFYISQWINAKEHLHMQIGSAKENFRFQKVVAFDKQLQNHASDEYFLAENHPLKRILEMFDDSVGSIPA